ncbi:TetR/AcrR family transcriptional regulator [Haloglycomyces albus]|uniref:TetR/AcrR family transcriptional regulator n=1 Tax=Haloglycomyces albus TaxID=526067 RepID=UPI00046CEA03|nr:TetR/AcrR family transcriptional regulator [Haloglycomyces albus]
MTRRERLRAETIATIKDVARRQLHERGVDGISLRGIAREMRMSPAAIYRYFDGREALVRALYCDVFDDLNERTRRAMIAVGDDPYGRMRQWVRVYREWALGSKSEFELSLYVSTEFGNPMLGMRDREFDSLDDLDPVTAKTVEHAWMCGQEYARWWRRQREQGVEITASGVNLDLSPDLRHEVVNMCGAYIVGTDVPAEFQYRFASAWGRIFGLIAMEVYQILPVFSNVEEFYRIEMASIAADLGITGSD